MSKTANYLSLLYGGILMLGILFLGACGNDGPSAPTLSEEEKKAAAIAALPRAKVQITTQYGKMVVELFNETPQHRNNFLKLVKEGFYDSLLIHRVQPNFMAQAGDPTSRGEVPPEQFLGMHQMDYRIPAEIHPQFLMRQGALCGYHSGLQAHPDKSSNGSQFMLIHGQPIRAYQLKAIGLEQNRTYSPEQIAIYEQYGGLPQYDGKYTVFGQIVEGLKVLEQIVQVQTHRSVNSQLPDRPLEDIHLQMTILQGAPDESTIQAM
jgi:cyclophilin family peptidyl-prolyl cis-trans isomerase